MEYRPLTDEQRTILVESINYNPNEDFNGFKGISLANRLNKEFEENVPNLVSLDLKKLKFYEIINSKNPKVLYSKISRRELKGILGKLKKGGYKNPEGEEMKDYLNMESSEIWNYYSELRKELNIFS